MFLKHELCLRFSFGSIFDAWRQIGACCSTNSLKHASHHIWNVKHKRQFLRLGFTSVKGWQGWKEECFAPWNETNKTQNTHWKSKAHCFLRSWLLPGSNSMLIFMFCVFVIFSQAGTVLKVIVCWVLLTFMDLPKLIQNTFENFSWKHVLWGFRGHFWEMFEKYFEDVHEIFF